MNEGWIKLHRSINDSKTFQKLTAVQKLIAIYLVLNANHKDSIWYDSYLGIEVEIKRGQLITSRNKIREWFNNDNDVSEQKIRTALTKLEKYGFLTIEPTKHYTLINIVKYEVYQAKEKEDNQVTNQALTNDQPSTNQALTKSQPQTRILKNVKNEKNVKECKEDIYSVFDHYCEVFQGYYKTISLTPTREKHIKARLEKYSIEQIKLAITNIRTSKYHLGEEQNNDKFYATLEFICRNDETLEKWINHTPKKVVQAKKNAFDNFEKRKYDAQALEDKLLARSGRD